MTPWTVAHQAPLFMGILRARKLEWVAMLSSTDLPNPGIKPRSPSLQSDSLPSEPPGKPKDFDTCFQIEQWDLMDFKVPVFKILSVILNKMICI